MHLQVVKGQIKIRNENGPTDQLGEVEQFICYKGKYYPLSHLDTIPPVEPFQIQLLVEADDGNPYLGRSQQRAKENDELARKTFKQEMGMEGKDPMLHDS